MADEGKILKDVKLALGIPDEEKGFDVELKNHISSAIGTLYQVGSAEEVVIETGDETWEQVFGYGDNEFRTKPIVSICKNYVLLKTKIMFDPPAPSVMQYMKKAEQELLWRAREGGYRAE